jgi:hypothetical protein
VAKEKFIVFLAMGHSNMAGCWVSSCGDVSHERTWEYDCWHMNGWYHSSDKDVGQDRGPGARMQSRCLKRIAEKPQYSGYDFGVAWYRGTRMHNSFKKGQDTYDKMLQVAKALRDNVTIGGVWTMIGHQDHRELYRYPNLGDYAKAFAQMISDFRADLGLPPEKLPFFVCDYEYEGIGEHKITIAEHARMVKEFNELKKMNLPNVWVISTVGCECYHHGHHFTCDAYWLYAQRQAEGMIERNMDWWAVPPDATPPAAPGNLALTPKPGNVIDLSWTAATDGESGILEYIIYRDNIKVGTSGVLTFSDKGLLESTEYAYAVSARNGGYTEGPKTAEKKVTTLADTRPPAIASIAAEGDPTAVTVVFDEPVEKTSAETASNYSIDNSIAVSAAALQSDGITVLLKTASLGENVTYTLTVTGVKDMSKAQTPSAGASKAFAFIAKFQIANITVTSGKMYTAHILTDSSIAYSDRNYLLSVPAEYKGMTYIQTANDDKGNVSETFLAFDVNQAVTVYVLYDQRLTPPPWLAAFTATNQEAKIGFTAMKIYTKDFPGGTITLGGNSPGESQSAMYSVIIKGSGEANGSGSILTILSPTGGECYMPGDKLTVRWEGDTDKITGIDFYFSPDGGITWHILNQTSIEPADTAWGTWTWTIQEFAADQNGTKVSPVSSEAMIAVEDYGADGYRSASKAFTIAEDCPLSTGFEPLHTINRNARPVIRRAANKTIAVSIAGDNAAEAALYRLDGRRIAQRRSCGMHVFRQISGIVLVKVTSGARSCTKKLCLY